MKYLLLTATAIALLSTPVLAQMQGQSAQGQKQMQKRETTGAGARPRLFVGPGIIQGKDVYDCTGQYLGSDPDPNIRTQLLREGDKSCQ